MSGPIRYRGYTLTQGLSGSWHVAMGIAHISTQPTEERAKKAVDAVIGEPFPCPICGALKVVAGRHTCGASECQEEDARRCMERGRGKRKSKGGAR